MLNAYKTLISTTCATKNPIQLSSDVIKKQKKINIQYWNHWLQNWPTVDSNDIHKYLLYCYDILKIINWSNEWTKNNRTWMTLRQKDLFWEENDQKWWTHLTQLFIVKQFGKFVEIYRHLVNLWQKDIWTLSRSKKRKKEIRQSTIKPNTYYNCLFQCERIWHDIFCLSNSFISKIFLVISDNIFSESYFLINMEWWLSVS